MQANTTSLAGHVVSRVVESICNDDCTSIGHAGTTIELLCNLETSAKDHFSTDEMASGAKSPANDLMALELHAKAAADALRRLMEHYGTSGGRGRKAIKDVSTILTPSQPADISKALASVLIVTALAIGDQSCGDHRSLARAAASGLLPNKPISEAIYNTLAVRAVNELLSVALDERGSVDLHIVTSLSRSYVQSPKDLQLPCAKVISLTFELPTGGIIDENTKLPEVGKIEAAAAIALSAQLGPWSHVKPAALVAIATDMNLWSAAERVCSSAAALASRADCEDAVLVLIESASAAAQYRQMDSFATEFYDHGGRFKYAEARLLHAYDTITKVAGRRQFPIIEKQIERVDRAFERVKGDLQDGKGYDEAGPSEARDFAITKLIEIGEVEAAHRLATLWKLDFVYDHAELERMAKARKKKYLQWGDTLVGRHGDIPDVLSDPHELLTEFEEMISTSTPHGPIGFDCEFGDEQTKGVALLQVSTLKKAILVDVPALSATTEGCKILMATVGGLFSGDVPVCGFACGEDVRRLRASPSALSGTHWLGSTCAVIDIKPIIAHHSPELKHTGLSKACDKFLKKPLDKAEQCSLWLNRPLSLSQRTYAALDAFTCAEIYSLLSIDVKGVKPNKG